MFRLVRKISLNIKNAPLAQLDRALVYGTKGQEFESLTARQQKKDYLSSSFFVMDCAVRDENVVRLCQRSESVVVSLTAIHILTYII